jgi:ribose 5-phosphate isomerase B
MKKSFSAKKIFLGSDHAGFAAKEKLKLYLDRRKINYEDLTPVKYDGDDYPEAAFAVATSVAADKNSKGILVCGSGEGVAIAANKVKGVRAVAVTDKNLAKLSRLHNDANVLGLSGWLLPQEKLQRIVDVWLQTKFSSQKRHKRRVAEIAAYEARRK